MRTRTTQNPLTVTGTGLAVIAEFTEEIIAPTSNRAITPQPRPVHSGNTQFPLQRGWTPASRAAQTKKEHTLTFTFRGRAVATRAAPVVNCVL